MTISQRDLLIIAGTIAAFGLGYLIARERYTTPAAAVVTEGDVVHVIHSSNGNGNSADVLADKFKHTEPIDPDATGTTENTGDAA